MSNVILKKTCNAFYPDAKRMWFGLGIGLMILGAIQRNWGLWVGGTFTAESEWLFFEPNILNALVQYQIDPVKIHASELRNVRRDSGWVTDIVIVEHARGEFKFRCYGADEVVRGLISYYFRSAY